MSSSEPAGKREEEEHVKKVGEDSGILAAGLMSSLSSKRRCSVPT